MRAYYNKNTIIKFYKTLKFSRFKRITPERKDVLDKKIESLRPLFVAHSIGLQTLMCYTAERLVTSSKNYGLCNGDEIAYFYIKMVDPNFLFLEVYESANMRDEIKDFCMKNFGFQDNTLIYLEKCCNQQLQEYAPDELWSRDTIKR